MFVLTVTFRGKTTDFDVALGRSLTVGRTSACDICVEDRQISRRHATFRATERGLEVVDEGSHNGTVIVAPTDAIGGDTVTAEPTGHRLSTGETQLLGSHDVVQIGGALITAHPVGRVRPSTQHDAGEVVVDAAMVRLYELAERIASSELSVLILGESGVGKDVLANFIHRRSPRSQQELVSINCGAVAESLLEAELFGYEKGAFTGAAGSREGLLETAHRGTLFFDEVGELTPSFQVKLLRVLESNQFMRVGGRDNIQVDVRYLAATNRDLTARVTSDAFREDLFYRLNGISLTIPALRERRIEIVPLAEMFLAQMGDGSLPYQLADTARAKLERYDWPGNVRQLRNVVRRAAVLCGGNTVTADDIQLPDTSTERTNKQPKLPPAVAPEAAVTSPGAGSPQALRDQAEALERQQILDALEACAGNQTRAAEMLGLTRRALVTRLNKYNIPRPRKGR